MGQGALPFRLDEGICLEDLDVMLPWDTRVDDLRHLASPEIVEDAGNVFLYWRNHVALGLSCDVSACRIVADFGGPSAYLLYLDTFHFAVLHWYGEAHWSVDEITASFKRTYEGLRRSLGDATFCQPGYAYTKWGSPEGSLPSIHWELGITRIGLSAQFPCHLVEHRSPRSPDDPLKAEFDLSIEHEPEGYEKLKSEARIHEQRHGAKGRGRVDAVVW